MVFPGCHFRADFSSLEATGVSVQLYVGIAMRVLMGDTGRRSFGEIKRGRTLHNYVRALVWFSPISGVMRADDEWVGVPVATVSRVLFSAPTQKHSATAICWLHFETTSIEKLSINMRKYSTSPNQVRCCVIVLSNSLTCFGHGHELNTTIERAPRCPALCIRCSGNANRFSHSMNRRCFECVIIYS